MPIFQSANFESAGESTYDAVRYLRLNNTPSQVALGDKLAALEGSTSQQFVESFLPKASLVTTPSYDEAVKLLLADEVNAVVADREIVTLTAFLYPKEGLATLREPFTLEPIGIAAPLGDAALVNYLENAMGALEASGLSSALRARWLERSDWVQELP